jgi:uncharacterized protein with von Willebrand factor type A (vWA) domain
MESRIVEFVELLREAGLPVGVSETQDAVGAVAALGLGDQECFRAALRATLCKRVGDREPFDRAFELVFKGAARLLEGLEHSLLQRLREEGLLEGDELAMIAAQLAALGAQLSPLTAAVLGGDRGRLAGLFRDAVLRLDFAKAQGPLQAGFYARRLLQDLGASRLRSELDGLERELRARGVSAEGLEVTGRHLAAALRAVEDAARGEVLRQLDARQRSVGSGLGERPLATLTRSELVAAQRAVRALAERLKSRLQRRLRTRRRGALSPRQTLRHNLGWGGVPMVPRFRARRAHRPDLVVLCDVSDSVRTTSSLMLLFLWTLQTLLRRVRSFVFVAEVGEVTAYFKSCRPEEAMEVALSGGVVSLAANSNYGQALAGFVRGTLGAVSKRTTVIIIGDGRNNYFARQAWALDELRRRAKQVLWVCTEPESNWGSGDSEMLSYAKRVNRVVAVQTLADLERLAPQLVLT